MAANPDPFGSKHFGPQTALQVHRFQMHGLLGGYLKSPVHHQVVAADFPEDFGILMELDRSLGVNTTGDRAFYDQIAAINAGSQQGAFSMDRHSAPGADTLGAAFPDFHIAQIDKNTATWTLGGTGFGGNLIQVSTIKT
jgi:hypothetical protein